MNGKIDTDGRYRLIYRSTDCYADCTDSQTFHY